MLDSIVVKLLIKIDVGVKFQISMKNKFFVHIYNYMRDYFVTLL